MSTVELQIAERARKYKGESLHSLYNFIDAPLLQESYDQLNKKSAGGVDGKTWQQYGLEFPERCESLLEEFKSGRYKAPAIRRVYIPKGKQGHRPLGIPTIEDKVLQASVRKVIEPIYEEEFISSSFGFRRECSQHQAIEYLFREVSFERKQFIITVDIQDFFGSIDHGKLREFLDERVKDGIIRRMIDKWLKAGVMESGNISYPDKGTPQGGIISPLLSNIYLHYVLDLWFTEQIQPRVKGKSFMVRWADDFILGFSEKTDALRVLEVLPKRFARFKLTLHPDKTRLIDLNSTRDKANRSFDFLGFTHYLGKSRKGNKVLKRKTSTLRLTRATRNMSEFIKQNRHMKLRDLLAELNVKLRGHYAYYGITFNSKGIYRFYEHVKRVLHKWLNRRGGKSIWIWDRFSLLVNEWSPLLKPLIVHSYAPL